jgi:cholesterol oxidase
MNAQNEHYDAVVIGSGFGGSINALRLAEAGRSVLVLERGRRYRPGEFPRDVRDVDRLFWRYPRRSGSRGLYDVRFFSGIAAVVASGVGGGSLIYANIHIRPDPVVFEDPRWPRAIHRRSLDPYYDRVAAMLGIAPIPADVPLVKRDIYREAARQVGRPVFDPDMASGGTARRRTSANPAAW